ncbi:MAG: hypothetical protein HFF00_04800 [Ruminiclostridium sp.]|jgi:hypothetical protein|nr:hypothetical protein [Ruminiclostridium sp.]
MKKTWFVIFLSLLLVISISGCRGDAEKDADSSGASSQNLSENEKLQKIANSLGYDRIEIEDTDPEHISRWGVKDVENPKIPEIIKEVWDSSVDLDILQYDDLDETYQVTGKTINISTKDSIEPRPFIDACEILFIATSQKNEFDNYDAIFVRVEHPQLGVISLHREQDGTYSTYCLATDEIEAVYETNDFFSSLDLTKEFMDEYASKSEDDTAALYWYLNDNIPGTWLCSETGSNLSQIDFLIDKRNVIFTYKDQEKCEFYWSDFQIKNNVATIEMLDENMSPFVLKLEPTQTTLTKGELLINSNLFRKG